MGFPMGIEKIITQKECSDNDSESTIDKRSAESTNAKEKV